MTDESMTPPAKSPFDAILHLDGSTEYWLARGLMPLLGYKQWHRFSDVLDRAMAACENAGSLKTSHFNHLPGAVSGSGRTGDDYRLSRHACYLVAMNGDPRKTEIAQAQSYFAIKTREAETQQAAQPTRPKSQAEMLIIYAQEFFAHDQRLNSLESDVQEMKQVRIDATKELHQLPPSKEPAPPLTERASLRQLINNWCDANNVNQQVAWRKLYTELYYRDGFSVNVRMKSGKYAKKIDAIVDCGKMSVLYAIACDIFRSDNGQGGSHA
jgi:hypothetical protein